jgi:membrane protein DedA with SNARE-associated domain
MRIIGILKYIGFFLLSFFYPIFAVRNSLQIILAILSSVVIVAFYIWVNKEKQKERGGYHETTN